MDRSHSSAFTRGVRYGRFWRPDRTSPFFCLAILAAIGGCGPASRGPEATADTTTTALTSSSDHGNAVKTFVPPYHSTPWFEDVTDAVGLNFLHDAGPEPEGALYRMPQSMGSGCALLDFDNDGRLDIYLIHNGGPQGRRNQLFKQQPDGRFNDVSAGSGLDFSGFGMGAAAGDVNNDGYTDLVVTAYGGTRLLLNRNGETFQDVSAVSGVVNPLWATSASFLDYDRDGWLDLVVANYVDYDPTKPCQDPDGRYDFCSPRAFPPTITRLFHNVSATPSESSEATVQFVDVTVEAGLSKHPGPGLGVVCADFNRDRWPDILIADDGQPNRLWLNGHDGTFQEAGLQMGLAYNRMGNAEANMGVAVGDVNGDGALDIFITHLSHETPTLWQQGADGFFEDRTSEAGLSHPFWRGTGFGTVFADFDCDGDLDLAAVNGRVRRAPTPVDTRFGGRFWSRYAERNQLFANASRGAFRDVSPDNPQFCDEPAVGRALAVGDIDGDGAQDLLATYIASPARLYRNIAPNRGHWLLVRARIPNLRRDAYGATIEVLASGQRFTSYVLPGSSYLTSHDPRVHFGLGTVDHVDGVRVIWPDGSEEFFPGGPVDRELTLLEGQGGAAESGALAASFEASSLEGAPAARGNPAVAELSHTDGRLTSTASAPLFAPPSIDFQGVDPVLVSAIVEAQARVRSDPASADAWGALGMLLMAHEFIPAALECYAQAERLAINNPRWPYFQGIALAGIDSITAIAKFERAVALHDDRSDAVRLRLAKQQLAEGLVGGAIANFNAVIDRYPNSAPAWLGLAQSDLRRGELSSGLAHTLKAVGEPRTRRAAYTLLTQIHARQSDAAAAEESRGQAARLPPDAAWPDPLYEEVLRLRTGRKSTLSQASRLLEQNRPDEALPLLRRAVEEQPEAAYNWTLLGVCELKLGRPEDAERALRRSAELEPNSVLVQFHLGMTLVAQDRIEDAAHCLQAALALKPDFALGHFQLAQCRQRLGDRSAALAAYGDAVHCQPNYVNALVNLGQLLIEAGQPSAAAPYLQKALLVDRQNATAMKLLSQLGAE